MTEGKDGTPTVNTPFDSRNRRPSSSLPVKRASTYQFIEKLRQHIHTDMSDIEAVVFVLLCPEKQDNSVATVPTVLEGKIVGRITSLPATTDNIQSMRSSAGCHYGIKGVAGNEGSG